MSKSILVTGATGTFGRAFLRAALSEEDHHRIPAWGRVVAYSRDEMKHARLYEEFRDCDGLRLFLGDVRDSQRLGLALRGVHTVVHAAALKRVDQSAYSPSEMVATNILGTMNVVNAAIQSGVQRVVVISSDKAVNPTNIYGATKFCAETYAVQANAYGYPAGTRIACVRYGNILGSTGSVIGTWRQQLARGEPLTITDPRMTRFVMTIEQAAELVRFALRAMVGGEVFIPVLPRARMEDLARAVAQDAAYPLAVTGLRPGGEKMAERLLNEEEPGRTHRVNGEYLAVLPSLHEWVDRYPYDDPVGADFQYRSDDPDGAWLGVGELAALISQTEACR